MKTFENWQPGATRPRLRLLLAVVGAVLLAFAMAQAAAEKPAARATAADPAGDAQKGKQLYHRYGCYQCHGYAAQGGLSGPRIAPDPLPYAAFLGYLREPAGSMPPYSTKVLAEQEIADVYAYLLGLPAPPSAKSTGLLSH